MTTLSREEKGIGAKKTSKHPLCQRKNEGGQARRLAIAVEKEENHEKGPRCSWARNQMGNIK